MAWQVQFWPNLGPKMGKSAQNWLLKEWLPGGVDVARLADWQPS